MTEISENLPTMEVEFSFEQDVLCNLVWFCLNGKRVGAVIPEVLIGLGQRAISAGTGVLMGHILLQVVKQEEPIKHNWQVIHLIATKGPEVAILPARNEKQEPLGYIVELIDVQGKPEPAILIPDWPSVGDFVHKLVEAYGKVKDQDKDTVRAGFQLAQGTLSKETDPSDLQRNDTGDHYGKG